MNWRHVAAGVMVGILTGAALIAGIWALSDESDAEPVQTPLPPATATAQPAPTATPVPEATSAPLVAFQSPYTDTIRRLVNDVFNDRNTDILDDIFAPDYVGHLPASETTWTTLTRARYRELPVMLHAAIPDIRITPELLVGDGDMVAMRAVLTGTFLGELYNVSPTREPVEVVFTVMYRFNDAGQIVEEWIEYDTLTFAQQFALPLATAE